MVKLRFIIEPHGSKSYKARIVEVMSTSYEVTKSYAYGELKEDAVIDALRHYLTNWDHDPRDICNALRHIIMIKE
jgi:hypothetical protein